MGLVMLIFAVLLLTGVPIAELVIGSASVGILADGTNPMVLVQQLFKGINSFTVLAVPFFIVSGDIAAEGLTSQKLVDVINALLGRLRGGLGIATIVACTFFGAITGSAIATVVAIGALMLPKLTEAGYPKALSLGIITCAGTIGVMIPPSIPMVCVCVAMGTSVSEQFAAGVIPGVITAIAMSIYVAFSAKKHGVPLQPRTTGREKLRTLKRSFWSILFPVIVLGSIYSGVATPTEASIISLLYVMIVELFIYKTMDFKKMLRIIAKSAEGAGGLTLTVASAQVFVWYMTRAGIPEKLYSLAVTHFTGKFMLLFAICLLLLVCGMFTQVVTVVMILGPLLKPLMGYLGIDLIHFGIIVIIMAQIGFVTPPFGICLFTSMRLDKASMAQVTRASIPFMLIMMVVAVLLVLVPQLSTFLPGLIRT